MAFRYKPALSPAVWDCSAPVLDHIMIWLSDTTIGLFRHTIYHTLFTGKQSYKQFQSSDTPDA